jgi:endonuclease/exonuclease/phosphatase family metal-dependent hydrolase
MKLKILSWNIWCGTYLDEVIKFLETADADIIALQEVAIDERGNIGEIIAKKLGYEYADAIGMDLPLRYLPGQKSDDKKIIRFGNAILSKHKILNSKVIELTKEDKRVAIRANIKIGNAILDVFSIHLKHIHVIPPELQVKNDYERSLRLQNLQTDNLIGLASKEKTIIMGDFNALSESIIIKKMNSVLQNTDKNSNTPTWSVYKEGCIGCLIEDVKYKLDYIFTTRDIKTNSFKVEESKGSDHLPISTVIEI